MSVDFTKNKLCPALVYVRSSSLCQLPCAAVKNVDETLKSCMSHQGTILPISTMVCGTASAIAGVAGAAIGNVLLGTSVVYCVLSTFTSATVTGLAGGTIAHYCVKKTIEHDASLDPKTENEQILPNIAEDVSKQIIINIED